MIHLLLHLVVIGIGIYFGVAYKVAEQVDQHYLSIALASIIWSFLTAVLVALKALFNARIRGKSEYLLQGISEMRIKTGPVTILILQLNRARSQSEFVKGA